MGFIFSDKKVSYALLFIFFFCFEIYGSNAQLLPEDEANNFFFGTYAVRNLKSCIIQVENMHLSGASEFDIMEKAKKLLVQDPKLKTGFKFDHVWDLMKNIPKFTDSVNVNISDTPSVGNDIGSSPTSQSPGTFSINLSSDDGGSNLSQRPIGSKRAKAKRKILEGNHSTVESLVSSNEQILEILKESAATRNKNCEISQLRLQNQAKKLALKEMQEENKILLTNLESIGDSNTREYIRSEQARIIQKRNKEQLQPSPSVTPNPFEQYYDYLGGGGSNLRDPML